MLQGEKGSFSWCFWANKCSKLNHQARPVSGDQQPLWCSHIYYCSVIFLWTKSSYFNRNPCIQEFYLTAKFPCRFSKRFILVTQIICIKQQKVGLKVISVWAATMLITIDQYDWTISKHIWHAVRREGSELRIESEPREPPITRMGWN